MHFVKPENLICNHRRNRVLLVARVGALSQARFRFHSEIATCGSCENFIQSVGEKSVQRDSIASTGKPSLQGAYLILASANCMTLLFWSWFSFLLLAIYTSTSVWGRGLASIGDAITVSEHASRTSSWVMLHRVLSLLIDHHIEDHSHEYSSIDLDMTRL